MDALGPILLLAGGELFLAAIGLRIAVWMARGWLDLRAAPSEGGAPEPPGPKGGLRILRGGRTVRAVSDDRLREAA
jgi:hypothetical protein